MARINGLRVSKRRRDGGGLQRIARSPNTCWWRRRLQHTRSTYVTARVPVARGTNARRRTTTSYTALRTAGRTRLPVLVNLPPSAHSKQEKKV
jgi:hypothetical protein